MLFNFVSNQHNYEYDNLSAIFPSTHHLDCVYFFHIISISLGKILFVSWRGFLHQRWHQKQNWSQNSWVLSLIFFLENFTKDKKCSDKTAGLLFASLTRSLPTLYQRYRHTKLTLYLLERIIFVQSTGPRKFKNHNVI